MKNLQILTMLFAFVATTQCFASYEKAARADQYERNTTAKERELVKEARRNPDRGAVAVTVTTVKSKKTSKK